jgi:hypothetical protein
VIHHFQGDISFEGLQEFTDPFRYMPHPLVRMAAEQIIDKIDRDSVLRNAFAEGKMLGVLVCKVPDCSKRAEHLPSSLLCELLQSGTLQTSTPNILPSANASESSGSESILDMTCSAATLTKGCSI